MPKIIELTVEIGVQKVSCPGVWLCQDGRVSLTLYTLGTTYQTCLLPPVFPLMFKDVFFFRKRYQESCALNNLCCLMKDETIYCELVQWSEDCEGGPCTILAQYLGSLTDVLFPPNLCWSDGVDLLMRRCKEFPGILSPKIEISTKVRIDEVWNPRKSIATAKVTSCHCNVKKDEDVARQKQVCHSPQYHRTMAHNEAETLRSRSRSRSSGSRSCCSLNQRMTDRKKTSRHMRSEVALNDIISEHIDESEQRLNKILLESRYIEDKTENVSKCTRSNRKMSVPSSLCICEICKRYHELFHSEKSDYLC